MWGLVFLCRNRPGPLFPRLWSLALAVVATGAAALVARIRAHTAMPVALGFGISRPEHVAEVTAYADAAVVGSALVSLIGDERGSPALIDRVEQYVRWLKGGRAAAHAGHAEISS